MIVLYKPGNIHTIRGVPCIREYFSPHDLEACLKQGWKQSPEETIEGVKENGVPVGEEKQNAEKENGANGERGTKRVHGSKKTEKTKKQEEVEDDFMEL